MSEIDWKARTEAAEAKCRLLVDAAPHHVLSSYAYRARIAELEARIAELEARIAEYRSEHPFVHGHNAGFADATEQARARIAALEARLARVPDREAVARALHERVWEDRECLGDACFGGSLSCICIGKLADAAIAAMQERAPDREAVALREFAEWVDTWVSNPAGSYSMSALEGLFMMTRDRFAAMQERTP